MLTSIAGQLNTSTNLGAAISIANVNVILTISHTRTPAIAVAGLIKVNRLAIPRANTAPGMITVNAP